MLSVGLISDMAVLQHRVCLLVHSSPHLLSSSRYESIARFFLTGMVGLASSSSSPNTAVVAGLELVNDGIPLESFVDARRRSAHET